MSEDEMVASIRAGQAKAWMAVYDLCLSLGMNTRREEPETGIECVERFIRENSSIATAALAWREADSNLTDAISKAADVDEQFDDEWEEMTAKAIALRLACDRYVEAQEGSTKTRET